MRVCWSVCLLVAVLVPQEKPPQKKSDDVPLDAVLGVNDEALRKDEFARLKAMTERYGRSVQARLEQQIEYMDAYCGLTKSQRRRLSIATRGPSRTTGKRLHKNVEATAQIEGHKEARAKLGAIGEEIDKLLQAPAESAFWKKTVDSTLTDKQQEALRRNQAARDAFEKKAWVFNAIDHIDRELLLLPPQRDTLLTEFSSWADENALPKIQRGRRGAWKMLPEETVHQLVVPQLDKLRLRRLIATAPYRLRESLQGKYFPEPKAK